MQDISANLQECLKAAFPPATIQLMQEVARSEPDFGRIAKIIALDPALTVAVLGLVNSPFYGLSVKVIDLQRAAMTLGTREILHLALCISFALGLKGQNGDRSIFGNWRMLAYGAAAATVLAKRICPADAERVFLSAMLKDFSLMLWMSCTPEGRSHVADSGAKPALCPLTEEPTLPDHPRLSLDLLTASGVPLPLAELILHHHDMDNLAAHAPAVQALILATRWSEVLMGCADPAAAMQFETALAARLELGPPEVGELRAECVQRYRAMLGVLNIEEDVPEERFYNFSLPDLQTAYLLGMEVMQQPGGLAGIAATVARHLQWQYRVSDFDLALRTPLGQDFALLVVTGSRLVSDDGRADDLAALSWRVETRGLPLYYQGRYLGELRIPSRALGSRGLGALAPYARCLAMGYANYLDHQALLESKARTLDRLPLGVARVDERGRLLECNRAMAAVLGDFAPGETDAAAALRAALKTGQDSAWAEFFANTKRQSISSIFCDLLPSGPFRGPCMHVSAQRHDWEGRPETLLMIQDVSGISELDVQALRRLDFLNQLLGSMQEIVLTVLHDGTVTFVSPGASSDLLGRNIFQSAKPVDGANVEWNKDLLGQRDIPPIEVVMRLRHGDMRPLELVISPLGGVAADRKHLIVGRDLTKVRRLEETIRRQAIYDGLTGLFNHDQFHLLLRRECRRAERLGRPLSLVFFDLDGFKAVNDTRGHQAGDDILRRMGQLLAGKTRFGLDYPCRYGGDEFAILFTETDGHQAAVVAERLREVTRKDFGGTVGLSIGVAAFAPGERPEDLLDRADKACYAAKRAGGNRSVAAPPPKP